MSSSDRRRAPTGNGVQPPTSKFSSLPRPTVNTNFGNYTTQSRLETVNSPPLHPANSHTNRAVSHNTTTPSPLIANTENRRVAGPSPRSVSGPSLSSPKSSPSITSSERIHHGSFKNLVAKFNQDSPEESTPPAANKLQKPQNRPRSRRHSSKDKVPTSAKSTGSSKQNYYTNPERPPLNYGSASFGPDTPASANSAGSNIERPRTADQERSPSQQQPLFGEVVPEKMQSGPGYGIPKSRRGSEGDMYYPNAMFPDTGLPDLDFVSNASNAHYSRGFSYGQPVPSLAPPALAQATLHHRSKSDFSSASPISSNYPSTGPLAYPHVNEPHPSVTYGHSQQSRIPVRSPRDLDNSENGLATSGGQSRRRPISPPDILRVSKNEMISQQPTRSGQRLKAVISTPAPKISPPLRSSRPRQDVNAARSISPSMDRSTHLRYNASLDTSQRHLGRNMDFATRQDSIRKAIQRGMDSGIYPGSQSHSYDYGSHGGNRSFYIENNPPLSPAARNNALQQHPESQATLSNAVYNKPGSDLKIAVTDIAPSTEDEPQSGETQFEDDSPLLGIPGNFPNEPQPIEEDSPEVENKSMKTEQEESLEGSNNQSDETTKSVPVQADERFKAGTEVPNKVPPSNTVSMFSSPDGTGTIQIMLSDEPVLNSQNEGWQDREQEDGKEDVGNNLRETNLSALTRSHIDGAMLTPSSIASNDSDRATKRLTVDSDSYSLIHRIFDQYRESGTISSDMVSDFQQYIVDTDPELTGRDDIDSLTIARAALEDMIRDHSGVDIANNDPATDISARSSVSYAQSSDHKDSSAENINSSSTSVHNELSQHSGATVGLRSIYSSGVPRETSTPKPRRESEQETFDIPAKYGALDDDFGGPTPPPKDDFTVRSPNRDKALKVLGYEEDAKGPMLPDIPSTGGDLGFRMGGGSQHTTPTQTQKPHEHERLDRPVSSMDGSQDETVEGYISPTTSRDPLIPQGVNSSKSKQEDSFDHEPSSRPASDEQEVQESSESSPQVQKRLNQRRHLIKELVDTEFSFNQDMKVIEDIYKGTANAVDSLSADDKRILFGNSADIVKFSEDFLTHLRRAAKKVYTMPSGPKWGNQRASFSTPSSSTTSERSSVVNEDLTDEERDARTTIGAVFCENMSKMERIYGEYLKNHDYANQRLQKIQTSPPVRLWLNECHSYATDITSAWSLDSLLVKPVQRILKYPLLLRSLLDETPEGHPDRGALQNAAKQMTDVSHRINESKKRAELLDQVVNKNAKRKDFDFSKVFARRSEKLRQQVGLSEVVEDAEFKVLHQRYGSRYVHLQIVMRDMETYKKSTTDFVGQLNKFVEALESILDVGHSTSDEIESRWRRFATTIREITAIAYADHEAAVRKSCIEPLVSLIKIHEGPEKLMAKRKKRIVEYAKYLTLKNKGEKIDKKTQEQGEQFIALNDTLKDELPKLFALTTKLVERALGNFVNIQAHWQTVWQKKIQATLEDLQVPKEHADIVSAFEEDFSFQEANASSLSICNGSLLTDIQSFISNTNSTSTEEARSSKRASNKTPRESEQSSLHSSYDSKRKSEGSLAQLLPSPRASNESHQHGMPSTAQANGYAHRQRLRAASNVSNSSTRTNSHASTQRAQTSNPTPTPYVPHQASRQQNRSSDGRSTVRPRTPSRTTSQQDDLRPMSSSTYYSTSAVPQYQPLTPSNGPALSGVFSSALPPHDSSPEDTRPSSPSTIGGQKEYSVLFLAASLFEFSIDPSRKEAGYPYLNYASGEIFDVIAQKGELWLAKNQDDEKNTIGWIWEKHFAKLMNVD